MVFQISFISDVLYIRKSFVGEHDIRFHLVNSQKSKLIA